MGILRFLLAAAVVLGHARGWGQISPFSLDPIRPIAPYYAVQAFFVISGFYMAMIKNRYRNVGLWVFWSSRYSRLISSYLVVVALTLLLAATLPDRAPAFSKHGSEGTLSSSILAFSNFTIFGTDAIAFINRSWIDALIIPQSWSLSLELWFYLLVPLFWVLSSRALWVILLLGLALRVGIQFSELPFFPWQQRFFPTEIGFFISGMLSYRYRATLSRLPRLLAQSTAFAGAVFAGWVTTSPSLLFSAPMAAALFLVLPSLWTATRYSGLDRKIGDLSYPIYLVHITVGFFVLPAQSMWGGAMLLLLSVIAAIPLFILVDSPLDRWREKRRAYAEGQLAFGLQSGSPSAP